MSFVFAVKVLFNRNIENYEKELWKTYIVSMPSAVIIIILGQTLSNRIKLFEGPHREDLEKSAPQSYNAFGLKATPELKTII